MWCLASRHSAAAIGVQPAGHSEVFALEAVLKVLRWVRFAVGVFCIAVGYIVWLNGENPFLSSGGVKQVS